MNAAARPAPSSSPGPPEAGHAAHDGRLPEGTPRVGSFKTSEAAPHWSETRIAPFSARAKLSLGRSRSLVLALMFVAVVFGAAMLVAGVIALSHGQPYGVYYVLILGGALCASIFGGLIPIVRRRYAAIELNRMAAVDRI